MTTPVNNHLSGGEDKYKTFDGATHRLGAIVASGASQKVASPQPEDPKSNTPNSDYQIHSRKPRYVVSDLILSSGTRELFDLMVSRVRFHEKIYRDFEMEKNDPTGACRAVSFYGPPGTGKTMCVDALAAALGLRVMEVSYAELESRWVGETPKRICASFKQADAEKALLFFDEADSILGARMTHVSQAADHAVNVARAVMLKEMESFQGVLAFATNLARNYDSAFRRRILQHVEVPLPDAESRKQIWRKMLRSVVPGRDSLDWDRIADVSDGLSGGEIKNASVMALARLCARQEALPAALLSQDDVSAAIRECHNAIRTVGQRRLDE